MTIPELAEEQPTPLRKDIWPILLAIAIFSAGSIWAAVKSEGFLEADSVTHYLYARFAFTEPHYLVNIWGRPLVTGLYMFPATFFGRIGVRSTSLVLALACGLIAYAIARGQKYRWPALALIFSLAQPLLFLHSFSELTELPFAALLGLAFLAYQRRQFFLTTILIAISPLARPEGFGFLFLAVIALMFHRRWWWIPLLAVPVLLWDYYGYRRFGSPQYATSLPHGLMWLLWLKHEWPYASQSLYDSGSIFHFVMLMPAVASPLIFPATCLGIWRSNRRIISPLSHRALCDILIAVIPLLILAGHSFLYATGRMASSGETRYMLIVAPFWGLLSAKGWTWIFEKMHWQGVFRWAGIAALLPALINFRFTFAGHDIGYQVVPLTLNSDMIAARRFARWYKIWPMHDEFPLVLAAHPGVYYFLDISPTQHLESVEWNRQNIAAAPRGTILVWDPIYGVYNSDANRSVPGEMLENAGWIFDGQTSDLINDPDAAEKDRLSVWLSPQTSSRMPTMSLQ